MLRAPAIAALLCACATVPSDAGAVVTSEADAPPDFVTRLGVAVYLPEPPNRYLTREMAETMEQDLLEAMALPRSAALYCLLGVRVTVDRAPWWTCQTRVDGVSRSVPCVGETDGAWRARIASVGRCAYERGRHGAPYEHELAHVLQRCLGTPTDWDHADPLWRAIDSERPCP